MTVNFKCLNERELQSIAGDEQPLVRQCVRDLVRQRVPQASARRERCQGSTEKAELKDRISHSLSRFSSISISISCHPYLYSLQSIYLNFYHRELTYTIVGAG